MPFSPATLTSLQKTNTALARFAGFCSTHEDYVGRHLGYKDEFAALKHVLSTEGENLRATKNGTSEEMRRFSLAYTFLQPAIHVADKIQQALAAVVLAQRSAGSENMPELLDHQALREAQAAMLRAAKLAMEHLSPYVEECRQALTALLVADN